MTEKYEPKNAAEKAAFTRDERPHVGWNGQVGFAADNLNALDAMGHRQAILERRFAFGDWFRAIEDPEFYLQCRNIFKRSLKGSAMQRSQYGLSYLEFQHGYTPDIVEALGTAKAIDMIKKQVLGELDKLAATHPIIVWRIPPEISTEHGWVKCYLRFHVMTEEQYQYFAQASE